MNAAAGGRGQIPAANVERLISPCISRSDLINQVLDQLIGQLLSSHDGVSVTAPGQAGPGRPAIAPDLLSSHLSKYSISPHAACRSVT